MADPIYLVCKKCGTKEWIQPHTQFCHCQCGEPRYAETEDGKPLIVFSADPTNWDIDGVP